MREAQNDILCRDAFSKAVQSWGQGFRFSEKTSESGVDNFLHYLADARGEGDRTEGVERRGFSGFRNETYNGCFPFVGQDARVEDFVIDGGQVFKIRVREIAEKGVADLVGSRCRISFNVLKCRLYFR